MSLYVLDTDTMTLYQHGHPRVTQQVLAHSMAELAIAVISVEEELRPHVSSMTAEGQRSKIAAVVTVHPQYIGWGALAVVACR